MKRDGSLALRATAATSAVIIGAAVAVNPTAGVVALFMGTIALALAALASLSQPAGLQALRISMTGRANNRALVWGVRLFLPLSAVGQFSGGLSILILGTIAAIALLSTDADNGPPRKRRLPFTIIFALSTVSVGAAVTGATLTGTLSDRVLVLVSANVAVTLLLAWAVLRAPSRDGPTLVLAFVDSLAIYLVASVGSYYVLDLRSATDAQRLGVSMSTFGVGPRVTYPFATALSTPPYLAAAFIGAGAKVIRHAHPPRLALYAIGLFASGVVLLTADNRGPIIIAGALVLAVFVRPLALARGVTALAFVAATTPFWWRLVQGAVATALDVGAATAFGFLSRDIPGEHATLQDRTYLWDVFWKVTAKADPAHNVFGYGAFGQIPSGMAEGYAPFLGGLANVQSGTAHNALLQQFTDTGLLGAAALLCAIVLTGLWVRRNVLRSHDGIGHIAAIALTAVFVALAANSAVESALSTGSPTDLVGLLPVVLSLAVCSTPDRVPIESVRMRLAG